MHYDIHEFPESVTNQEQNISVKFTSNDLNLELITKFSIGKSFEEAYRDSDPVKVTGNSILKWNVLGFEDLITGKIKSGRPKDLLDVLQLKALHGK